MARQGMEVEGITSIEVVGSWPTDWEETEEYMEIVFRVRFRVTDPGSRGGTTEPPYGPELEWIEWEVSRGSGGGYTPYQSIPFTAIQALLGNDWCDAILGTCEANALEQL